MSGHSLAAYGRIAIALRWSPETNRQLAARHGVHLITMRRITRCLLDLGILHIAGMAPKSPHCTGIDERIYREGERIDAPKLPRVKPQPMLIAFASLWRAMKETHSVSEIARITGLNKPAIYRFIADATRPDAKYVRIAAWRGPVALYRLGPQADAPKPERQVDNSANCRRWRGKVRRGELVASQQASRLRVLASNASIFTFAQGAHA